MPKVERGLPKSFDIKVPRGPVTLGDYLDDPPAPVLTPALPPPVAAAPALELPPPSAARQPGIRRGPPPRKQFNMSPETMRMLDELLAHIRAYSAERDVRASEVVHALVMAVHEVRPYLDLTSVPPRGKWGSTTAGELPVALKEAFQSAISQSRRAR